MKIICKHGIIRIAYDMVVNKHQVVLLWPKWLRVCNTTMTDVFLLRVEYTMGSHLWEKI